MMTRTCLVALVSLLPLASAFLVPSRPATAPFRRGNALNYVLDGQEIPGPLKPIHNCILVKVKEAADISAGGIVLPDQAKEKPTEGQVVDAGPGRLHPETAVLMKMCVSPGSNVLYGKFDGMKVEYNNEAHVLIRDDDVLLTWDGPVLSEETVKTVRDRILVKVKKPQEKTAGGILLAPTATKQRQTEGEVVKVGPGRITSTGAVAEMPLAPGDKVKFRDYAGTEVKIGANDYMVMYATDVLAKW